MAQRVEQYDVFVFSDTPKGAFASSLGFVPGVVLAVNVRIPGGHSGKTGIQVWYQDSQLLPRTEDTWFVGNKTSRRVALDDPFPGGIGWRAEAYNNGKRNHTFYVQLEIDELTGADVTGVTLPPVLLLRQG